VPDTEVIAVGRVWLIVREVNVRAGDILEGVGRIEHEGRQTVGKLSRLGKEGE
jgi:hypothetical protein